jgi:hypothetical protein
MPSYDPKYKYKSNVIDNVEDAKEIIRNVGKAITEGKSDKNSALDNLARAIKKLEEARYFIDRGSL